MLTEVRRRKTSLHVSASHRHKDLARLNDNLEKLAKPVKHYAHLCCVVSLISVAFFEVPQNYQSSVVSNQQLIRIKNKQFAFTGIFFGLTNYGLL